MRLAAVLDHVAPGRSADSRPPNARELAATAVLALDLVEVSAKVRTGGPVDDADDLALPHWAGVVPLTVHAGTPVPADDLAAALALPSYLTQYRRELDVMRHRRPAGGEREPRDRGRRTSRSSS